MNQTRQNYVIDNDYQLTRHRVLRNTYWLLALSMIPTILGAIFGVQIGFSMIVGGGLMGALIFLLIAFGFMFAIQKTKNSGLGVVLLLAFTFFMGMMLSGILAFALHNFSNGAELIAIAFGGTATILGVMATIATVSKRDFSGLGSWLFAGVIMLIIGSLLATVFHLAMMTVVISVLAIAIFSAYILYDVQQIINGGETNYISATLSIYLDIYNIFVNLLNLLMIFGGNGRR
jgi:FtsH-binding integral membrane protein